LTKHTCKTGINERFNYVMYFIFMKFYYNDFDLVTKIVILI